VLKPLQVLTTKEKGKSRKKKEKAGEVPRLRSGWQGAEATASADKEGGRKRQEKERKGGEVPRLRSG
jgi:hypothetical protein